MFDTLPKTAQAFMDWDWSRIQPYVDDLLKRELTNETVDAWLQDWTQLTELLYERFTRAHLATAVDTNDKEAEAQLNTFLETIYPATMTANNQLQQRLVESNLQPNDFDIPLRNMKAELEIFHEDNLPLLTQEQKLTQEYDKIIGAQTVEWDGKEVTLQQLNPVMQDADRNRREDAWRLGQQRRMQDRTALNELWAKLLQTRQQIATNADFTSYRDYRWRVMQRFDYTPQDCETFHAAIEKIAVPAAQRIYEKRRQHLGIDTLRPWDLDVDPLGLPPLRPFQTVNELVSKCEAIFNRVDVELGEHFSIMRRESLLDLDNRKGKAPGGWCMTFDLERRPFIFMNAVGLHRDVQTALHEGGHAFHVFESQQWPYIHQLDVPMEFAEVASMAMELLAAPYLVEEEGGFYSPADAARARIEHLEEIITFWPYMAVVDAFQHWVYQNPADAANPDNCDIKWGELWDRFMIGIDWTGLDSDKVTGWQRKMHIFQVPFYYIEYGLAQLGAVQVWQQSLSNWNGALQNYRKALSLAGMATLPELFATAGAAFAFDSGALQQAIELIETTINQLDSA